MTTSFDAQIQIGVCFCTKIVSLTKLPFRKLRASLKDPIVLTKLPRICWSSLNDPFMSLFSLSTERPLLGSCPQILATSICECLPPPRP